LIAETISPARALEVIRKPGHGFGASGEDAVEVSRGNFLKGERDRLDAGGAGLVDGVGGDLLRDGAADGDLAGGVGTASGLAGVAEDGFFDLCGRDVGAFDRGFGGNDSHVGGGERS